MFLLLRKLWSGVLLARVTDCDQDGVQHPECMLGCMQAQHHTMICSVDSWLEILVQYTSLELGPMSLSTC